MSGECDYCGAIEHTEDGCPVAKDPDKMWEHGRSCGYASGWNDHGVTVSMRDATIRDLTRQLGEAENKIADLKGLVAVGLRMYEKTSAKLAEAEVAVRVLGACVYEYCKAKPKVADCRDGKLDAAWDSFLAVRANPTASAAVARARGGEKS